MCVYLQYVHVTGSVSDERLRLFSRHRLGETSTLTTEKQRERVNSADGEVTSDESAGLACRSSSQSR